MLRALYIAVPIWATAATSVGAQDFIPNMNAVNYNLPQYASPEVGRLSTATNRRALGVVSGRTPTTSQRSGEAARVSYTPSMSRRRTNLAQFVAKSRATDPQGAAAMERLFAQGDIVAILGRELAPFGLRTDNLAYTYAVWWMNAWQAAHGDVSTPDRDQAQAVKAQATRALLATPEIIVATDAQKQEFAEALLLQAALIASFQEKYKGDATQTRRLAAAVRQGAMESGVDLDAMLLTQDGFVPAGRTGAADPAPSTSGGMSEAIAAGAHGEEEPSYALLAVAGGAGLGAALLLGKALRRNS